MLIEMFKIQEEFQNNFITKKELNNFKNRQQYINLMLLSCFNELSEIQNNTLWKHKNYIKYGYKKEMIFNEILFKKEIIDIWHFIMNLWLSVDGTPEEFYNEYINKNNINKLRQKNKY